MQTLPDLSPLILNLEPFAALKITQKCGIPALKEQALTVTWLTHCLGKDTAWVSCLVSASSCHPEVISLTKEFISKSLQLTTQVGF